MRRGRRRAWSPRGGRGGGLAFGLAVQAVTVAVVVPAAYAILARRDPAA